MQGEIKNGCAFNVYLEGKLLENTCEDNFPFPQAGEGRGEGGHTNHQLKQVANARTGR
jgi:hypothetical protein